MAHTTSRLSAKLSTEAVNNEGIQWSAREAQTELLLQALGFPAGSTILTNYTPNLVNVTATTTVPAGVLSWSFVWLSGAGVVTLGAINVQQGIVYSGGGYNNLTSKISIPIVVTGVPQCVLMYDTLS